MDNHNRTDRSPFSGDTAGLEHHSISNPLQARRLKALGGITSVNNCFTHFRSLLHRTHAYGPDRSDTMARLASFERGQGVRGIGVSALGDGARICWDFAR